MATQYNIYRLNWRCSSIGAWSRLPGRTRLATYPTAAEAEADLRLREGNVRIRVNPFHVDEVDELTSMPFAAFLDLLRNLGLTLPTREYPGWGGWWETLREDQRSRLWDAFDRLRFYEAAAEPALPLGYAVLEELNWMRDGVGMRWLNDEGGVIRGVYRDRERVGGHYSSSLGSFRGRWLPADEDPFDPETHWRAYARPSKHDVVQVNLEGGLREPNAKKERKIHLVVRRVWEAGNDAPQPLEKERVPVCAFPDRKSAEHRRRELEAAVPEQHDLCALFAGWFDDNNTDDFFAVVEPLNLPTPDTNVPKWWCENRGEIASEQRRAMWKLFPERRVYEVIESTLYE